jgi:hypothetical protein
MAFDKTFCMANGATGTPAGRGRKVGKAGVMVLAESLIFIVNTQALDDIFVK